MVELLQGKLSKNVMERVCREADGLFPAPSEIKMSCSCPDWAGMCKHVAATLYGVGARLDSDPDLLFALRGVDRAELVSNVGADLPLTRSCGGKRARARRRRRRGAVRHRHRGARSAPRDANPRSKKAGGRSSSRRLRRFLRGNRRPLKPRREPLGRQPRSPSLRRLRRSRLQNRAQSRRSQPG